MRDMIKVLLSVGTMCALGQSHSALAGNPVPGQNAPPIQAPPAQVPSQTPPPIPTDTPASTPTTTPTPTDQPTDTSSTPDTQSPSAPVSTDQSTPLPPDTTSTSAPPAPVAVAVPDGDTGATVEETDIYSYSWNEPMLSSGIGISAILGGGVAGFTDKQMRSTTSDLGGLWDLRIAIGSHVPLALELGYVGTATNITGLPAGNKGTLIGTTAEAALRWNVLPHFAWTPYLFGGAGWQRYDVTQTHVSLSDSGMNDHDNLLVFPMGAGIAWRTNGFVADLRGTFRAATDEDLVLKNSVLSTSSDFVPMHTWEASAALGYEF
jgi:hypothetical protein